MFGSSGPRIRKWNISVREELFLNIKRAKELQK